MTTVKVYLVENIDHSDNPLFNSMAGAYHTCIGYFDELQRRIQQTISTLTCTNSLNQLYNFLRDSNTCIFKFKLSKTVLPALGSYWPGLKNTSLNKFWPGRGLLVRNGFLSKSRTHPIYTKRLGQHGLILSGRFAKCLQLRNLGNL